MNTNQYWRLLVKGGDIIKSGDEYLNDSGRWEKFEPCYCGFVLQSIRQCRRLETLPTLADEQWHPSGETPTKFPVLVYWLDGYYDVKIIESLGEWSNYPGNRWWKPFTPPPPTKSHEELAKEKFLASGMNGLGSYQLAEAGWDAAAKFYKSVK